MERRIGELNKEIEKLTHARNALRILKYSAWGGMPLKEDKALMDDIKNLDRKFADEINGYQREIEEIEKARFADMHKEREDFICNHICNGCKSRGNKQAEQLLHTAGIYGLLSFGICGRIG